MYVSTTARYLGDPMAASGMVEPNPARLAELSKSCAAQWKAYQKAHRKNFPHKWRAFLAANPVCREGIAIRWGYQPPLNPCADANTGLLIDCWDAALQKGVTLNGLGAQLTQAQLTKASKYYANLSHAQQVALRNPTGYIFNGKKMVRNRITGMGRMGQDDFSDTFDPSGGFTDTSIFDTTSINAGVPYSTPVDTSTGVPYSSQVLDNAPIALTPQVGSGGPTPLSTAWWNQITSPSGSASSSNPLTSLVSAAGGLIAAATGGGQNRVGPATSVLQTSTVIPGVPNVILYGGAAFLLLAMVMGNKRR